MRFASIFAAIALAVPAVAVAQALPGTHSLAWHPSGKTPSAIPQMKSKKKCVADADHHKGSKGPVTPVVRCSNTSEMAQAKTAPQTVDRGE